VGGELVGGAAEGPLAHLARWAAPAGTRGRARRRSGRTSGYGAGWRGPGKQFTGHSKRGKGGVSTQLGHPQVRGCGGRGEFGNGRGLQLSRGQQQGRGQAVEVEVLAPVVGQQRRPGMRGSLVNW
jgi:hypothetical protein